MKIKGITDECFSDYKLPAMFIAFPKCSLKCDKENGTNYCQNSKLLEEKTSDIDKKVLIERYLKNPLTKAVVCGGLEPFDSELDLLPFIDCLRRQYECNDKIIIYTGYTEEEITTGHWGNGTPEEQIHYFNSLIDYGNIIIKYGRFRPNEEKHFDEILGVNLSSLNQYAKEY